MDDLSEKIMVAVNESLPQQVGDQLRKRLQLAHDESVALKVANNTIERLQREAEELRRIIDGHSAISKRQHELAKQESEVTAKLIRAEVMELKVSEAQRRADSVERIVSLVFQNNRFKYTQTGMETVVVPGNHYTTERTPVRTVEGES